MKKSCIYILIIIIVIIAGVVIGVNLKEDKTKETASGEVENKNEAGNKIIINEVSNNSTDENVEEINNVTESIEENPQKNEEVPKTDLEKAIDIVKKDWGVDSSVYFAQDGQTQTGEYIICVRDSETTNALMWYKVNVQNETCEEW